MTRYMILHMSILIFYGRHKRTRAAVDGTRVSEMRHSPASGKVVVELYYILL